LNSSETSISGSDGRTVGRVEADESIQLHRISLTVAKVATSKRLRGNTPMIPDIAENLTLLNIL
jgi:hypothetical protein